MARRKLIAEFPGGGIVTRTTERPYTHAWAVTFDDDYRCGFALSYSNALKAAEAKRAAVERCWRPAETVVEIVPIKEA